MQNMMQSVVMKVDMLWMVSIESMANEEMLVLVDTDMRDVGTNSPLMQMMMMRLMSVLEKEVRGSCN